MNTDDLQTFKPECKYILLCPDCPQEYEVNQATLEPKSIIKCPYCGFTWIVE